MEVNQLNGTNPVNITGSSPSQNLISSFTPTNSNPLGSAYYDNNMSGFIDKIKDWFSNLGTGINNLGNYFKGNFPDSIFNLGSNKIPQPALSSVKDYLKDTDLPDWVNGLFNNAIQLFNDNLNRQYKFNSEEAEKDRLWQEYMSNTSYQRALADLKAAGINPLLAFGGISGASTPGGSSASGSLGNSNSLFSSIVSAAVGDKKILASLISSILGIFRVLTMKS